LTVFVKKLLDLPIVERVNVFKDGCGVHSVLSFCIRIYPIFVQESRGFFIIFC
jgi:hypothetical protein